jgi:hypothetical protein
MGDTPPRQRQGCRSPRTSRRESNKRDCVGALAYHEQGTGWGGWRHLVKGETASDIDEEPGLEVVYSDGTQIGDILALVVVASDEICQNVSHKEAVNRYIKDVVGRDNVS